MNKEQEKVYKEEYLPYVIKVGKITSWISLPLIFIPALIVVLAFGARHKIPADNCHIREGLPDEIIPEICRELKPTALFLGTSAHKGLAVAVLGNICEKVIDELDCDVAVTTPKSVIRRIPTSERTR